MQWEGRLSVTPEGNWCPSPLPHLLLLAPIWYDHSRPPASLLARWYLSNPLNRKMNRCLTGRCHHRPRASLIDNEQGDYTS